ncbi:RNA-directed DNA polymerase, eukaryota, reverse transcriptase zinc-binding domain protein [Tanacetum coccineum]
MGQWIRTVKLNGKNFWEVSVEVNESWGWKNLLEIRDEVNKYVRYKLGDGKNTSMWYDNWCELGLLFRIVSNRSLYNARLTRDMMVVDMCIPKQSFILWMAIQGKLMTCDRMAKWGSYDMTVCALCKNNAESHDHLFFNCPFSMALWKKLKTQMQFQSNATVWNDIVTELAVKPNKSSIWSIVRRLCLAGAIYSIWRERNNRVFRDEEFQSSSTSCYQVECDSAYEVSKCWKGFTLLDAANFILHQIRFGRVCLPILGQFGLLHRKMYHKEGAEHCEGALLKEDRMDVLEGEYFLSSDAFCVCCFNLSVRFCCVTLVNFVCPMDAMSLLGCIQRYRSVSKPWKSFIDSSDFIKDDDNNETIKAQQQEFAPFVVSPLLKQYRITSVVGGCHGLLCLYCYNKDSNRKMLVIL